MDINEKKNNSCFDFKRKLRKVKKLLSLIALNKDLSLSVVLGGSLLVEKYGKIINSSADLKKIPVYYVPFILEGDSTDIMAKSTSLAINEFVNAFSLIKLRWLLSLETDLRVWCCNCRNLYEYKTSSC